VSKKQLKVTFLADSRTRWFVLAALWLVLLALGIGGFLQQAHEAGLHRSLLDTIYLSLQLATLNYGAGTSALNWRLQVARFVTPVMAAGTVLQTASLVFAEQFRQFRLRVVSGHTVVCGLGEVGTRLALAFADAGHTVVAIEPAGVQGVAAMRRADITVVAGDATDLGVLRTARVGKAARVISVSNDDATNVQIALTTARVPRTAPTALRCAVHLTDAELTALLRAADLDAAGDVRISFFNVHEQAARALVAEHSPFTAPPTAAEDDGGGPDDHLVVMGLGQLGRSLVVTLAQTWAERCTVGGAPNTPPLRLSLTLVDRIASGRWESLCMQHPALRDVCDATVLDLDLEAPTAAGIARLRTDFEQHEPTWLAVAYDDEALALSSALLVQQGLVTHDVPIVVRTRTETGLGALLQPRSGAATGFSNLGVFPFLDRTCTVAAVDDSVREQLARAVHDQYLTDTAESAADPALYRRWADLADDQRELSRQRVDGVLADLESIGCVLAPLRSWGAPAVAFGQPELEVLAEHDHARWCAARTSAGWSYGATRDNVLQRNPLLVPWSELPDEARTANLAGAAALPAMLARAGFEPAARKAALMRPVPPSGSAGA
jgi:hypothetical protein